MNKLAGWDPSPPSEAVFISPLDTIYEVLLCHVNTIVHEISLENSRINKIGFLLFSNA